MPNDTTTKAAPKATEHAPWGTPPPRQQTTVAADDVEAYAYGRVLAELLGLAHSTTGRSVQVALGSSEAGAACDRRIAYRLAGVRPTSLRDPLRTMIGTGFHLVAADAFRHLSEHTGRFLVEHPVVYRDVPGTCDLFDRSTGTVIDWKTTTKDKISHLKSQGPSPTYVVQGMLYAAGLAALGFEVRTVVLAFVPIDGELKDIWCWRSRFDQAIADAAIDRVNTLVGRDPASVSARPDRLCGWCDHYQPGSRDLAVGCPGTAK